jgi:HEAT repeat protein
LTGYRPAAAAEAVGSIVEIVTRAEKKKRRLVSLRDKVIDVCAALTPAAARGLTDADVEVRRSSAFAVQQAATSLADVVYPVQTEAPPLFTPGRPLTPAEEKVVVDGRDAIDQERLLLGRLSNVIMDQGKKADSALARGVSDADLIVRILARNTIEEVARTRQWLLLREGTIPPEWRDRTKKRKILAERIPLDAIREPREQPALWAVERRMPPADGELPAAGLPRALAITPVAFDQTPTALPDKKEEALWQEFCKAQVQPLAKGLADADVRGRLAAVHALEMIGEASTPVAASLVGSLADPDPFVRWAAARTLGKLGPVKAHAHTIVPALAQLLGDPDLDLRIAAANALERYGPDAKEAVPALARTVGLGDIEIRIAALRSLEGIGSAAAPAVPAIIAALDDPEVRLRRAAVEVLGRFVKLDAKVESALRRAMADSDPLVSLKASSLLLGSRPLPGKK